MAAPSRLLLAAAATIIALTASACGTTPDYPLRRHVTATVFWVGEEASADNDQIPNAASAWDRDWQRHYGGVDDPEHRTADGSRPAAFTPRENPFYVALPYDEFTDSGSVRPDATRVPWYDTADPPKQRHSILKNRWVRIDTAGRTAYAQWEDVGPFQTDDADYVFGSARPKEKRAGIDLSPATAAALRIDGKGEVSWRFVEAADVPAGPWTQVVTRSGAT